MQKAMAAEQSLGKGRSLVAAPLPLGLIATPSHTIFHFPPLSLPLFHLQPVTSTAGPASVVDWSVTDWRS